MTTLKNIPMWELTEPLKWTAFKRISLLFFIDPFRYEKPKVKKIIDRDLKIAKAENEAADLFIRKFAIQAENEAIKYIPF